MTRLDTTPPELAAIDATDAERRLLHMLAGSGLNLFGLLRHAPQVFRGFGILGGAFLTGSLPASVREAAILRVAAILGSDYEWGHHVVAARAAGLSDAAIADIRDGRVDGLGIEEAVAVRVADAVEAERVDDALWSEARAQFDERAVVELVALVGYYGMASRFVLALDVDLDPGIAGLGSPS